MLKDFVRAFSIVAVAAAIGYEIGVRQWEDEQTEKAVRGVVSLNNQLRGIQQWAREVGSTMTAEEFAKELSDRLDLVSYLSRRI